MRLYSLTDAIAVDDPVYGHFEPDPANGGFELPDELAERLHRFHVRKRRAWETDVERDERTHGEERDRRRDPETLYNAVEQIANATRLVGPQAQPAPADVREEIAALRAELAELRAERQAAAEAHGGSGNPVEGNGAAAKDKPVTKSRSAAAKSADPK